jgi:tellurite resistance protein TehA-like permease
MNAYVITTGVVFGLVVLAHVLRAFAEGSQVLKQPWFILFTVAAAALFVWAMSLLRRSPRL